MPAYMVTDIEVTDAAKYEGYKALSPGAIAAYGGRFLVRGGATHVMEGTWVPKRMVVVEFPDMETAKRFYDGPEYRKAREARAGAANFNAVLVEGI